ncbi:serine hydrolase domain-containing protein [Halobacterium wangiae]|uniref:serine hydrolase domain-containing protein n=1 Tax=Halobacterium wangiae TaxID=2902623 RepID=UPI001E3439BB|nr:serine hydrolase domain-containing protein [Halobacterium wangiae]
MSPPHGTNSGGPSAASGLRTCSRRAVLGGLAGAGLATATPVGAAARQPNRGAQAEDGPLSDPVAFESFLDDVVQAQLSTHDIAGATVSVVDGETSFAKGYGYRDVAASEPVDAEETLFRIGSVSKLFTWTAAMQAVERGDLDVDVDVNQYLDAIPIPETYPEPVTLDHLATHTAGFEDRARGTFAAGPGAIAPLETVLREEQPARVRPPGRLPAYSNYGAALAGHLAATADGTTFESCIEQSVLEPLDMTRSTFAQPVPERLQDGLSEGFVPAGDGFRVGDFEYVGLPPTGSMAATATDMAKFVRAHLQGGATDDGRILDPESVAAMHRRRFGTDERLNGMCFGFYELSRDGVRIVGHEGDTELFHSLLVLLPEHDVGLFVSYNSPGGVEARRDFLDAFVEQYYSGDDQPPLVPDGRPERASELTGTYRSLRMPYTTSEKLIGATDTVLVSVDDRGRLRTVSTRTGTQQWVQQGPLYFEEVGGPDALAFGETDGEVTHLFFDSRPPTAYSRIARWEEPLFHATVLAVSLLVFLSALVGWPTAAVWRRAHGRSGPPSASLARWGRWVAGTAAGSYVGFVVVFGALLVTDPLVLFAGDPFTFRVLLLVALLGAVASVASAGVAVLAWWNGYWGRWRRLHYSLIALAGVATALVLAYWNLLWYQA